MKLSTTLQKYKFDPSPSDIMSIVFDFESGLRHKTLARKYNTIELIIRKIVDEYAYHSTTSSTPKRRAYWIENKLLEYIESLSIKLGKDISVNYNAESYITSLEVQGFKKKYNPDCSFYKHFTDRNKMNYAGQKSQALKRDIGWEFTGFEEWLVWWLGTGKFDQRGVTNEAYQMCRYNDTGSYRPDNVYCATGKENKELYHTVTKLTRTIDYTGSGKTCRPVQTPLGYFPSMKSAADAHNIGYMGLYYRVKKQPTEYYQVKKDLY
jgi:hypothetical protein